MIFSIAMTFSRFVGDGIVTPFGNRIVLTLGGVIALLGLCGLLLAPVAWQETVKWGLFLTMVVFVITLKD